MGKYVNIRNILKGNIQKHSDVSNGYLREISGSYQSHQLQYCPEDNLRSISAAIATYIFAKIRDKSLKTNKKLYVTSFSKPKNIETLNSGPYYRQIGVNKHEGPFFCCLSNQYKLDVTYYQWSNIYEVVLQNIFCEKNKELFRIHEYIAYNSWKWGHKFIIHWKSICRPILSNIQIGWIIFVDSKYLLISWLPKGLERYAFPGYASYVASCGGKEINVEYEYEILESKLRFVDGSIWYMSHDESYEIVSTSPSNIERLFAINCHQKKVIQQQRQREKVAMQQQLHIVNYKNGLFRLHLGLKNIRRNLKSGQSGQPYHFGYQVGADVWFGYLKNALEKLNIDINSNGYVDRWNMLISEANMVFCYNNSSYFQKNYNNSQNDIVYMSAMRYSMSRKSGFIRIDSVLLKRNDYGLVEGTNTKHYPEFTRDLYSLDTVLSDSILYILLKFMDSKDFVSFQSVSIKCNVMVKLIKQGMNHTQFVSTLY